MTHVPIMVHSIQASTKFDARKHECCVWSMFSRLYDVTLRTQFVELLPVYLVPFMVQVCEVW